MYNILWVYTYGKSLATHLNESLAPRSSWKFDRRLQRDGGYFFPSRNPKDVGLRRRVVHGSCHLPEGYALQIITPEFRLGPEILKRFSRVIKPILIKRNWSEAQIESLFETWQPPDTASEVLSASYSLPKTSVALFQIVYASITLYRSRGDQLIQFGYASFGLTVTPYLIMSCINLVGSLLTPDYPAIFMVRTEEMDEASRRGGRFVGEVAMISPDSGFENRRHIDRHSGRFVLSSTLSLFLVAGLCYAVNGSISHFKKGQSTTAERSWTMIWLVFGLQFGPLWASRYNSLEFANTIERLLELVFMSMPAIGGFVVVGQQIRSYGSCTELNG